MNISPQTSKVQFIVLILIIGALMFSWGFLAHQKKVFPYQLLKNNFNSPKTKQASFEQDKRWAEKIVKGGYILHFRHAQREKWNDVYAFDAYELAKGLLAENESFSKAVCLTDQGKEEAKLIGHVFKQVGVSINHVVSSPSCRARQTANLAFGRIDQISNSLLHRTAMRKDQYKDFAQSLKKVIDRIEIKAGSNVVLSGHSGTLSFDKDILFDVNEVKELDGRKESGFLVLEKIDGKLIARYKFSSFHRFANAIIKLPIN